MTQKAVSKTIGRFDRDRKASATSAACRVLTLALFIAAGFVFSGVTATPLSAADENVTADASAESASWPWTKLVAPDVPEVNHADWVTNPIDHFVLSQLEQKGFEPAPLASPAALLRRIQFGLVGLPPSPAQMQSFVKEPSFEAYLRRIEELLDDESYGERWGRHWLDLVRYADTRGGAIDYPRPHMWRYRDYVIRAFNQDRPYDRFIREQLAADAYAAYGNEGKIGLAYLHQWVPVERDAPQLGRRDYLNDVVGVTGSVFLGVSLRCARCHDHKYDPLPTRDYYRIEAFFAPLTVSVADMPFGQYETPLQQPDRWKQEKESWTQLLDTRQEHWDETLALYKRRIREKRRLPSSVDLKDMIRDVSDSELRLAMNERILFNEQEQESYKLIRRQTARFANPNSRGYHEPKTYTATDSPLKHSIETHVLSNGNYKQKQETVEPGYLSAITGSGDAANLNGLTGSRRKLLAEWIASPDNPLTARVMVNRIWQYHFGKGLVSTTSDFGKNGSGTVHQDLIDWLAIQFIESGWSIKDLHRLILTSSVYRQSMKHPRAEEFDTVDPQNEYLWVRSPVRLEAEVIRDNVLAVSGQLSLERGGPPFFPVADDELMRRASTWWEPSPLDQRNRRTVYMLQIRSFQLPFIKVFDGPNIDQSCPVREVTTVTPQVFALFNSRFLHDQTQAMAQRIEQEAGRDHGSQVDHAYRLTFQRSPSPSERSECVAFLHREPAQVASKTGAGGATAISGDGTSGPKPSADDLRTEADQPSGPRGSLADLCLVLLNSNEFVFIE